MTLITWQWCTISCSVVYLSISETDGSDTGACLSCSTSCLFDSVKILSDLACYVFIRWYVCLMCNAIDNDNAARVENCQYFHYKHHLTGIITQPQLTGCHPKCMLSNGTMFILVWPFSIERVRFTNSHFFRCLYISCWKMATIWKVKLSKHLMLSSSMDLCTEVTLSFMGVASIFCLVDLHLYGLCTSRKTDHLARAIN